MSDERSANDYGTHGDPPPPALALPREQILLMQAGEVIENLRSQMTELDRREQNVAAQTTALENERRRLRLSAQEFDERIQQREEQIRAKENALNARIAEIEQTHREQQASLQNERENIARQRAERERQWEEGIGTIEAELADERNVRRAALEAEMLQLAETIAAEQAQWEAERARIQHELTELNGQLGAVREEKLGEIEKRETTLQRKQVDLEKRTRFHETHLQQLRQSLQQQQTDLDRQQQLMQVELVRATELLEAQRRQLCRNRDRLTQREESLDRERHLLDDLRRTITSTAREEQNRWTQDRNAWAQECEAHRADMRRQQDMLALHAQNLEARRARLDQLRDDLEQTHRDTLELRLAVEQAWGQLSQTFGEETTRKRLEQARSDLIDGYEKIRRSLIEQQSEIEDAEQRLVGQREHFRAEREEFTVWMIQREQQLQHREEVLQRKIQTAADNEAQWRKTRERWTIEKIEAESVIRQLLDELDADLTRPAGHPVTEIEQQAPVAA